MVSEQIWHKSSHTCPSWQLRVFSKEWPLIFIEGELVHFLAQEGIVGWTELHRIMQNVSILHKSICCVLDKWTVFECILFIYFQDLLMVMYLSNLTRTQLALNEKLSMLST